MDSVLRSTENKKKTPLMRISIKERVWRLSSYLNYLTTKVSPFFARFL